MENKEYEIETIQDIADMVTVDNIDNFMKDFRGVLLGYMTAKLAGGNKSIPMKNFKWIDDGVVEAKLTMSAKDSDESLEIKLSDSRTQGEKLRD